MRLCEFDKQLIYDPNDPGLKSDARFSVGDTIGRVTITDMVGFFYNTEGKKMYCYYATCSCGNPEKLIFEEKNLKNCYLGHKGTISCGCARKEMITNLAKTMDRSKIKSTSRYDQKSPVVQLLYSTRSKVFDSGNSSYKNYGAKGITICDEWQGRQGTNNFCDWAMNNGYQDGDILKRKDIRKGYSPDNCYFRYNEGIKLIRIPFEINYSGNINFMNKFQRGEY